ncbi:MAG: phosphomannomutase/phosphoglucomutase [Deltaproteobacteria bacterium]|nr:phosphomannomutase/phosphoglucomutase [Deltaproteobacteria bacterium]
MNPYVFRKYDIRGKADRDLTDDFVRDLGRAVGTYEIRHGARKISLGRDVRLSSDRLRATLLEGILGTGVDVVDIGVVPTPVLYFSMFHLEVDGSVMITGSHNPPDENGFKVGLQKTTIFGDEILKLKELIENRDFESGSGSITEQDVVQAYIDRIAGDIRIDNKEVSVVFDAGNGTAGPVVHPLMERLGIKPDELFFEPDGNFPNHHPDPTVVKNLDALIDRVKSRNAIAGIAFDGDADRIGVVDASGEIIWGDKLMIIFSRDILEQEPGGVFVSEVKCSKTMYDDIEKHGGKAIMWKTGHSLIKAKMHEEGALLAGEMSGHMFFRHRYYGYDDAIYSAARLLEILSKKGETPSQLLADVPKTFSTPEIRRDCPDEQKFRVVDHVKKVMKEKGYHVIDVDGVRVTFEDGWGLVRASNTGPVLVLRFEAESESRLQQIQEMIEAEVKTAMAL